MKICLKGIFLLAFYAAAMPLSLTQLAAQSNTTPYFVEDDQVVFVFDVRDYAEAVRNGVVEELDFSDLDIQMVAIAGEFNNWSKDGWKMKKKNDYVFELRKKISAFNDVFPMNFKFVINEEYFAQPNITFSEDRVFSNDFLENTYNVQVHDVKPKQDGNTFFFIADHENAKKVILTGDFIGWDEHFLEMEQVSDGWMIRIDLPPGRYEYKFIVDGNWTHDIQNPNFVPNEHQTLNSILQKSAPIEFILAGYLDAEQVYLVGSFSDWGQIPMTRTETAWKTDLPIGGGKHRYKFVVDGKWILDPANPIRERGHEDIDFSILLIR